MQTTRLLPLPTVIRPGRQTCKPAKNEARHMSTANLNISAIERRMFKDTEAASYKGGCGKRNSRDRWIFRATAA
jgi:hypothetical protein